MTQLIVQLTDKDYQKLKKAAKKSGKPVEMFAQEVLAKLEAAEQPSKFTKDVFYNFEGFDSEAPSDLSLNVDKYLYGNNV